MPTPPWRPVSKAVPVLILNKSLLLVPIRKLYRDLGFVICSTCCVTVPADESFNLALHILRIHLAASNVKDAVKFISKSNAASLLKFDVYGVKEKE